MNKTHSVNGITEEADPTIYSGKVIRPLRSVDPTQTEYQGMIEIVEEGDMKGEVYPFGIVGMANKGIACRKGRASSSNCVSWAKMHKLWLITSHPCVGPQWNV